MMKDGRPGEPAAPPPSLSSDAGLRRDASTAAASLRDRSSADNVAEKAVVSARSTSPAPPALGPAAAAPPVSGQAAAKSARVLRANAVAESPTTADTAARWARIGDNDRLRVALDRGDDPNQADPSGMTSLHHAVVRADRSMIGLLLERGADPNKPNRQGLSPIDLARSLKRDDLVSLLQR